jgi:hypothetical protein
MFMHSTAKFFHYLILAISVLPAVAIAGKSTPLKKITSGEYISNGGRGVMNIEVSKKSAMTFDIQSGSERGVCDLKGEIKNNKAVLATELDGLSCEIKFANKSDGIVVSSDESEACRSFCGVNANFTGLYIKPTTGCGSVEVAKADQSFNYFYERKAYEEALSAIQPVFAHCTNTSISIENAQRRKNVAITFHKLKKFDQCLSVLEPLRDDASKTSQTIKQEYMPMEADAYISILKTVRQHLKLCAAKK